MNGSTGTRTALVVLSVGLAATGLPGIAAAEGGLPERYTRQALEWKDCPFKPEEGARPSECAMVTVPRDHADPGAGKDLKISISRVKATGERLGALLVNPGGPGGQGTPVAGSIAGLEPEMNQRYDVIGMDPRGTGHAGGSNGYICTISSEDLPDITRLDARDRSEQSIAAHQQVAKATAESCERDPIAPYITTWQTAHDMDLIRTLLGDPKLNYLGYSYGTWLGAKYASLFPGQTGKMILDSNVNWQGRLQAAFEDFPRIGQRWFDDVYLPWITRHFPKLAGSTVAEARDLWEKVREFAVSKGIPADTFDSFFVGRGSTSGWALTTSVYIKLLKQMRGTESAVETSPETRAMLDERTQAKFGVPFDQLTVSTIVDTLAPKPEAKLSGTRYAVACGDQPTKSVEWYRELSDEQGPKYPLFGWAYGLGEPCGPWSGSPTQTLPTLPPEVAGNVLVIQGEFDPQTAYEQGKAAVDAAPGVSMVSVDNSPTHGQYAMEGNACVDGMVNVFLLNNSRPNDSVCPSLPLFGENEVFPVDGPVTATPQPSAPDANSSLNQALRELLQDQINEINNWSTR